MSISIFVELLADSEPLCPLELSPLETLCSLSELTLTDVPPSLLVHATSMSSDVVEPLLLFDWFFVQSPVVLTVLLDFCTSDCGGVVCMIGSGLEVLGPAGLELRICPCFWFKVITNIAHATPAKTAMNIPKRETLTLLIGYIFALLVKQEC